MRIIWDEVKRQSNIQKHGFDFAGLNYGFFLDAVSIPAKRGRRKAIGYLEDYTIAVIYAALGAEALSVVSMRPASLQERKYYESQILQIPPSDR